MSLRHRRRRQRIADPLPVKPFLTWFSERVGRLERCGHEDARLRALADIGWNNDAGNRRLIRWQSWWVREKGKLRGRGDLVLRSDVEDALAHAGARMWELVASQAEDGLCRQVSGSEIDRARRGRPRDVLAYIDDVLAERVHRAGDHGKVHCELRRRLLFMQRAEFVEEEPEWSRGHCGSCREDVPADRDGSCLWCGEITEEARVARAFGGTLAGVR